MLKLGSRRTALSSPSRSLPRAYRHSCASGNEESDLRGRLKLLLFAGVLGIATANAHALPSYSALYVFGDSLSDSGNNSIVFDTLGQVDPGALPQPVPPGLRTPLPVPNQYMDGLVPTYPYQTTQLTPGVPFDQYTNGAVWAETFAAQLGLTALPSLAGGTSFAFAGARTGPSGSSFPFSLTDQVGMFAAGLPGSSAPSTALYVIAGGGNNTRDTLNQLIAAATMPGATPQQLLDIINNAATGYANDIGGIVTTLEGLGATHIVVWNTPDVGLAPQVLASPPQLDLLFTALLGLSFPETATYLAEIMNQDLAAKLTQLGSGPAFDLFGLVDSIVADPSTFGLLNVNVPCAALPVAPDPNNSNAPFCDPSRFLFWDGIHPTSAGQIIIADAMAAFVPEPSSLMLLAIAAMSLAASSFRRLAQSALPSAVGAVLRQGAHGHAFARGLEGDGRTP